MSDPHFFAADLPFAIGGRIWPGLSKLIEESGEVVQVAGKLMGTGGLTDHWDGSDLRERLEEELADLQAAIRFVITFNDLDSEAINDRADEKMERFEDWHDAALKAAQP